MRKKRQDPVGLTQVDLASPAWLRSRRSSPPTVRPPSSTGSRTTVAERIAVMRRATGKPARMWGSIVGFDAYRHKYADGREIDMLLTGFSPRKQDLVLYLGPGLDQKGLLAKLGKHRTGKGCLYLKRLDDV